MTKKTIIAGAIGLALTLGCDDEEREGATYQPQEQREITQEPEPYVTERAEVGEQAQEQPAGVEQPAGLEQPAGVEQQEGEVALGEPAVGEQPQGMELTQGEPMSRRSGRSFEQTVRQLRSELQSGDYVIAGVVPLSQARQQQRAQRPQQEEEQAGAAKPEGQVRAELILFASRNALGDVQGDPLTVLGSPTAILVYEDQLTGDVMVGFEDPELSHIVDASIAAGQQQGQQPQGQQQQGQQQQGQQQQGQQQPQGMQQQGQPQPHEQPQGLEEPEGTEETELDTY